MSINSTESEPLDTTMLTFPELHSGHIGRCFSLRYGDSSGTAFLHSFEGKVAFVTAAHVVGNLAVGDSIWLRGKDNWSTFKVAEIKTDDCQDVCVFSIEKFWVSAPWKEPEIEMLLAQPLVYLGFPHSLCGDYPGQTELVTPLAKVAHFSGNILINDAELMVLDGINNPGFSGGPVFHLQAGANKPEIAVVGIIHGFKHEQEQIGQVYRKIGEDGDMVEPIRGQFVKLNSGMILASSRRHFEKLFEDLEVGLEIVPA